MREGGGCREAWPGQVAVGGCGWCECGPQVGTKNFELARLKLKLPSCSFLALDISITQAASMKRKSEAPARGKSKKRAISDAEAQKNFRSGLFDSNVRKDYTQYYAASQP